MSKIILPSTNINSVDDPGAGYILLVGDSTNGIKAKDENGNVLPLISGTPGYGAYFNSLGEVEPNYKLVNGTNSFKIQNGSNSFFEASDELSLIDQIFGFTISGTQILNTNDFNNLESYSTIMSSYFDGYPGSIMQVGNTYGIASCFTLWDANHQRWRSSLAAEWFEHDVLGFIAIESSPTYSESRIELEMFNTDGRKSSSKWYLDYTLLEYYSPTYSMAIYFDEEVVSLGNIYGDRNSTKLVVDDFLAEIKLFAGTVSVNGLTGYSGTYSADGQIVTVTNGLITSVV